MYTKTTLKNGLRVITVPDGHTKAATVLVLFRVGSRYEPDQILGMSHFVEHMMFKGTKRRPNTADISRELDAVGAEFNAFTGKDMTCYYIKIASKRLPLALDMLHDMLYGSKFAAKELNQERKVIMEEIHMYLDNPMRHIEDMVEDEVFAGSTLGRNIAGDKKSMDAIDRAKMVAFKNAFYTPSRTVVVVAGKIGKAMPIIKKLFGSVPKRPHAPDFAPFESRQKEPRVAIHEKKVEQVQLAMGFPGYSHTDKRAPALSLLANILGGTMSSRLFLKVRERKGLAYFVRAAADPYEDTGIFLIRAGLTKARLEEAIQTIAEELAKIKKSGVSAAELKAAKENVRGRVVLELENSSDLASFFGTQEIYTNKTKTPEARFAEINAVTAAQIKAAARDVLRRERCSLALIGPAKNKQAISRLLKF